MLLIYFLSNWCCNNSRCIGGRLCHSPHAPVIPRQTTRHRDARTSGSDARGPPKSLKSMQLWDASQMQFYTRKHSCDRLYTSHECSSLLAASPLPYAHTDHVVAHDACAARALAPNLAPRTSLRRDVSWPSCDCDFVTFEFRERFLSQNEGIE